MNSTAMAAVRQPDVHRPHRLQHLDEPRYGVLVAAQLAGFHVALLRRSLQRGVMSLGTKHFTGTWQFSIRDVLTLAMVRQLTMRVPLRASAAAKLAKHVVDMHGALLSTNDSPDLTFACGITDDFSAFAVTVEGADLGSISAQLHAMQNQLPPDALRRPVLLIPVGAVMDATMARIAEHARKPNPEKPSARALGAAWAGPAYQARLGKPAEGEQPSKARKPTPHKGVHQ